ncbi:TonB-dependent receptor [Parapontixanthobacter aurantiacus]|uniref:TonB-dependent receptor n=1 Tax=Parapontixanthobacter aurantiacus TaxID=1463599 RepID=UPI001EEEBB35|nr:TonB-dependent receptor [Parapontixanthobacter aurantiacus]
MIYSSVAFAQEADEQPLSPEENVIIVSGIRQSLANAQDIKRDADTVVDAITAEDIGALPDRSVTEALQRVPGIAINRFAGSNDPDHFSVEGSGVTVRGLNFVRSEFNGRTAFAAGVNGQALNFADVPSELLGSVIISKNATADMIEGGLAGTVNLNTRKPFDSGSDDLKVAFSAEANYGDFREEWTPTISGLISKAWTTDAGRFGILVSGAFSQIKSRADGLQVANYQTRDGELVRTANTTDRFVCRNPLPAPVDEMTLPPANAACGNFGTEGADGFADYADYRVAPVGGQFRTQDFNRKRDGIAASAQWESLDERTRLTAEFIRSHTTNDWGEYTYETAPDLTEYSTYPLGCQQNANGPNVIDSNNTINPDDETPPRAQCPVGGYQDFVYDEDGLFQSGYIVDASNGWRGAVNNYDPTLGSGGSPYVPIGGSQFSLAKRGVQDETTNTDYSLRLEHQLTDRLAVELDAQYATSRRENLDVSILGSLFADQELDISGEYPVIVPHAPQFLGYTWSAPSPALDAIIVRDAEGNPTQQRDDAAYFSDPRFQFWRAAMDHAEDSQGDQFAFAADFTYEFDDDAFIRRVKFGGRYQGREQDVRYTTYNWGRLSEVWTGSRPINVADVPADASERYEFPNFFRGEVPGPPGAFYYAGNPAEDYNSAVDFARSVQDLAVQSGATIDWQPLAARAQAIDGTPYLPSDIQTIDQDDYALYAMINFGSDDLFGDVRFSGNLGVRYVNTKVRSASSRGPGSQEDLGIEEAFIFEVTNPDTGEITFDGRCAPRARPIELGGGNIIPGGICTIGEAAYEALRNFADGSLTYEQRGNNYDYFLPSANLKFGLTDDLIVRLAASKVLTRPENSYIRNYFTPRVDTEGNYLASAGDPTLLPATAWQFDASVEWYFATVGSLTFNAFYKDVKNFFYQQVRDETITNAAGETRTVNVRGPANFDGSGKIKGFEVAYQQTFDFLPQPLDGFGVQANYTYIDSQGLPNTFLNGGQAVNDSTVEPGNLPLEQLSEHNYNVAGFYEKGAVSVRAAYNWRSRFLLTASDVIFPYYSIFNEPTGQLDASAFLNIGSVLGLPGDVRIGVQGVNLLNEVTKTTQAYTGNPDDLAPRSYFMNDRRFSFIIRGNF